MKRPGAPNMNHAGMIPISQHCMDLTKDLILSDPLKWLAFRVQILAGTHQLAPSHYNADPIGWDLVFEPQEHAWDSLGVVGRSAMTLWYLVLVWAAVKNIRTNPALYLSLLGVIAYFTFASHFLNGGEQARMRYTIEPIYLFFSAGLLMMLVRRFRVACRLMRPRLTPRRRPPDSLKNVGFGPVPKRENRKNRDFTGILL